LSCETTAELNPCISACMMYAEISRIAQRPASERSGVENTLLEAGPKVSAAVPVVEEQEEEDKQEEEVVRPWWDDVIPPSRLCWRLRRVDFV